MKRDEVRSIIEGITDEQLDAILKMNGDSVNAEKAKTATLRKQLDEANDKLKAADDEKQESAKAAMTLEERIKAMEDSYAAKERELSIERNRLEAQKIFASAGLSEEDYSPLMATVVSDDPKATESNANAIAALVASTRSSAEQSARQSLLADTPKPGGATGENSVTKEQLDVMTYAERLNFFNESPEQYKELNK